MKRTLHLTSPLMTGSDVRYAQRLLLKNVFETRFLVGGVRGKWGEPCTAATKRAKWELGYPSQKVNGTFGTKLERYLRGSDPLPRLYKLRRKKRLRDARKSAEKKLVALAEAKRWIGTKESPTNSNIAKPFTPWYGWIGWGAPWCAVFTSYCMWIAKVKSIRKFREGDRWAYVPYIIRDARAGNYGLSVTSWEDAEPGDLVCFDWDDDGIGDHVGFLEAKVTNTSFMAIEGNTSVSSNSNGGQVMRRERRTWDVVEFVSYE